MLFNDAFNCRDVIASVIYDWLGTEYREVKLVGKIKIFAEKPVQNPLCPQ